jgi:uridine kinase
VRRIIAIAGPSGSGKTTIATASGLPVLSLDAFYRSSSDVDLPRWMGDVDWEHPASFDLDAAVATVHSLVSSGRAEFHAHDLVTETTQAAAQVVHARGHCLLVEGVMAIHTMVLLRHRHHDLHIVLFILRGKKLASVFGRIRRDVRDRHRPWHRAILRSFRVARVEKSLQQYAVAQAAEVVDRAQLRDKLRDYLQSCQSLQITTVK